MKRGLAAILAALMLLAVTGCDKKDPGSGSSQGGSSGGADNFPVVVNDEDIPAAHTIYGRNFARIRSLDQFADTVGTLIQNQIRSL